MERAQNDNHAHKISAENSIKTIRHQALNLEKSSPFINFTRQLSQILTHMTSMASLVPPMQRH